MRQNEVEYVKRCRDIHFEKIENFKLANLGKTMKNKISDFSYSFYGKTKLFIKLVKYADSANDKVEFYIKLVFDHINDEFKSEKVDIDLTINQFYSLFNDFQKIETMIQTLI